MPSKKILIALSLQFLANAGGCSNTNKHLKILQSQTNMPNNKLFGKDILQTVGNFLEPESAQKMRRTSKQLSNVKIYENIFPNGLEMAVFKHIDTKETIWKATEYKKQWWWEPSTIKNKKELVSLLRQNKVTKWNGVFEWISDNRFQLKSKKLSQNASFLKKLMLKTAENVHLACNNSIITNGENQIHLGCSPLMLAVAMDDTDSILTLIKRRANVHQRSCFGGQAIHIAAESGSTNSCHILLDNNADVDANGSYGSTPLERAAYLGNADVLELLLERGASRIESALQKAKYANHFRNNDSCIEILEQWQNYQ